MAKWYQVVLLGLGQLSARGVVLVQALTSSTLAVASGSLAEAATVPSPLQVREEETWYGVHRHWYVVGQVLQILIVKHAFIL